MVETTIKGIENPAFELQETTKIQSIEVIEFEDLPLEEFNKLQTFIKSFHDKLNQCWQDDKYSKIIWVLFKVLILVLYTIYFIFASIHYHENDSELLDWCNGFGLLILLTIVIYSTLIYALIQALFRRQEWNPCQKLQDKIISNTERYFNNVWVISGIYATVFLSIFIFLLVDTANDRQRLRSFFGLLVFVFIAVLFSNNPARIRYTGFFSLQSFSKVLHYLTRPYKALQDS